MGADTVTAICAVVVAVASLLVSVVQLRAVRLHNRNSVRPLLEFWTKRGKDGRPTGLFLANRGLGPAIITKTALTVDGRYVGEWTGTNVRDLCNTLPRRPRSRTFYNGYAIPVEFEGHLLELEKTKRRKDNWFWELITRRLQLEISYESLYGGENFKAELNGDFRKESQRHP